MYCKQLSLLGNPLRFSYENRRDENVYCIPFADIVHIKKPLDFDICIKILVHCFKIGYIRLNKQGYIRLCTPLCNIKHKTHCIDYSLYSCEVTHSDVVQE